MTVGPIQIIVFGFERTDQFRGEVLEELYNLRNRGLIRLIDLLLAMKTPAGEIIAKETNDLTEEESVEFGQVIGKLLGVSKADVGEASADAIEKMLAATSHSFGLDYAGIQQLVYNLEPGKAFGVFMFEHTWAIALRDAIRRTGGVPLAQGFLTQEALAMVGAELEAIVEAERTIEVAQIVQSAVVLDTLATLQEAEAIKTAVAADVLRTLVYAELIEEAALSEAIDTLAAKGLLEAEYLEKAIQAESQEAGEAKKFFAESE